jgi:epsilon-lactone hydrolase
LNKELETIVSHLKQIAKDSRETAGDIEAKRNLVDKYFSVHPSILETTADICPVNIQGIKGEWILGESSHLQKRLLYIHGGSWMAGRVEKYRPHIARLANATSCAVLAIDYSLTPEAPFPAGLNDCVTAFEWICSHSPQESCTAESTFIAGDSAGGNLTLATLLKLKDTTDKLPNAAIALSAATDLTWSSESISTRANIDPALNAEIMPLLTEFYLQNNGNPTDALASPLYGELSGLPPLLLQVGDAEILLDDSVRFAEKAKLAGVDVTLEIYPEMPHVFQGFAPYLSEANIALINIGEFVKQHS